MYMLDFCLSRQERTNILQNKTCAVQHEIFILEQSETDWEI